MTNEKDMLIVNQKFLLAKEGWGVGIDDLMCVAAKIVEKAGEAFQNQKTRMAWVRLFRVRHRILLLWVFKAKDIAKANAKNPVYIQTLENVFKTREKNDFFGSADWNSGHCHYYKSGNDYHVTEVLTTFAAGDQLPPQLVAQGRVELK